MFRTMMIITLFRPDVNLSDKSEEVPMPMGLDEPIGLMLNPMGLDADRRQTWVTMICWAEAEH